MTESVLGTDKKSIERLLGMDLSVSDYGTPLAKCLDADTAKGIILHSPSLDIAMKLNLSPLDFPPVFPTVHVHADGETIMTQAYYTLSDLKSGRRREMKLGRAVKFIAPSLSDHEVSSIYERVKSAVAGYDLKFAVTATEIASVYLGGPNSCMFGEKGLYGGFPIASLYAYPYDRTEIVPDSGNTLAVAYHGDISRARSRAVVDMVNKKFARIYGNERLMFDALIRLGFTQQKDFILGQRLSRKSFDGTHLCPWIDAKNEEEDSIYNIYLPRGKDWMSPKCDGGWKFTVEKTLEKEND